MEKLLSSELSSPLGRIYKNWPLVQLKDITLKIGSGATPRGGSRVYLSKRKNTAFIRSQNVFDRYFDDTGLAFISDEHAEQLSSVSVLPDDVLLNITGDGITYGRACQVREDVLPACVNQHVAIIRPNPNLCSSGYLLSYLTHPQIKVYMESFNAGGSRRAITKGHIESFKIPLPPLPTQQRIAQILGRLDDKIEVNRRINRTLEAMAQALYQHWFVDFGPFQDGPFVESELGLIPEGWQVKSLDKIADFLNGLALQKFPPEGDDYLPVIKIAEMRRGITEVSGRASPNLDPKYIVEDGDVLFSWSGSLLLSIWSGGSGALNQHLFKVTSFEYPKWFYYYGTSRYLAEFQEIAAQKATTMGHIQRRHLSEAKVLVPLEGVFRWMNKQMTPLLDLQLQNDLENRKLAEIRDYLLPKLLSGEIAVTTTDGGKERIKNAQ